MNISEILKKIDLFKNEIDNVRPFSFSILKQLKEYYRIGLTYSSNALEGNSLTESETKVVLEDGLTIGGKPLSDTLEALGHSEAYDFMLERAGKGSLSEYEIKNIHKLFYYHIDNRNAGLYRNEKVIITGTSFLPPSSEDVPDEMKMYVKSLEYMIGKEHTVTAASFAHREFVRIHPFIDGNGRTARLLMNLVLFNAGYPITVIPPVLRSEYITLLKIGHESGNYSKFDLFIAERVFEASKELQRLVL